MAVNSIFSRLTHPNGHRFYDKVTRVIFYDTETGDELADLPTLSEFADISTDGSTDDADLFIRAWVRNVVADNSNPNHDKPTVTPGVPAIHFRFQLKVNEDTNPAGAKGVTVHSFNYVETPAVGQHRPKLSEFFRDALGNVKGISLEFYRHNFTLEPSHILNELFPDRDPISEKMVLEDLQVFFSDTSMSLQAMLSVPRPRSGCSHPLLPFGLEYRHRTRIKVFQRLDPKTPSQGQYTRVVWALRFDFALASALEIWNTAVAKRYQRAQHLVADGAPLSFLPELTHGDANHEPWPFSLVCRIVDSDPNRARVPLDKQVLNPGQPPANPAAATDGLLSCFAVSFGPRSTCTVDAILRNCVMHDASPLTWRATIVHEMFYKDGTVTVAQSPVADDSVEFPTGCQAQFTRSSPWRHFPPPITAPIRRSAASAP